MPYPALTSGRTSFLVAAASLFLSSVVVAASDQNWSSYLGDAHSSQYSTLDQITPANVAELEVAWTWEAGDARGNSTQIQCNPLVIDGVIYATTPSLDLVALDGKTGALRWRYAAHEPTGVNRGVAWWADGDDQRILFGAGKWLQAVDARTGKLIESFGEGGRVDLAANMGRDVTGFAIQANTPGIVVGDLIVMGMRLGEGPAPAAPGPIRAYDVRTGELRWVFNTIPQPGEPGYETWPEDAYTYVGGVNVWTGMSVDEERGLLFAPTGSAAFDFWGGDRLGDNLYANCLLAIKVETGELVWHYQFVRHDIWDRDLPAPPNLLTVTHDGQEIDAVAQITKSGHVFVFNRETGEPLFPMEEVIVPSSDLAGEVAATTQPLPLKPAPFARQFFTAAEVTNRTPEARRAVLERFARLRAHTQFAPPSEQGTIIFPGFDGGGEWGGAATDPRGVIYVNANEMAWVLTMIETGGSATVGEQVYLQNCVGCHGADRAGNNMGIPSLLELNARLDREQAREVIVHGRGMMPPWGFLSGDQLEGVLDFLHGPVPEPDRAAPDPDAEPPKEGWVTYVGDEGQVDHPAPPYTHTGYNRFLDPDGYPAVKPPWGTLNAIDLNSGEFLWTVPLGELPELSALGIPPTGTENYGGPVVTAGGVLFIGASKDEHFRAFDTKTGRELWRFKLPAGAYATPSTYEVDGRQYVVVACGGGKMGTKSGDTYVAFALPE
ncbi:PQQ-binding-like beta-propeller repeat protein [Actomonas aquatica]|uniref:PQQ-binding-like beta-propeller repeat protein n=1 Tax=Actomonas aquatica TaxID=2866162 RepID=A0ABZ1CC57_9BACT|nr:PQQ-binding-like beta-propeller repeat protein [Opitutus sp. WL0086]WRQ88897.1 PQQ-binding-like beta-propeller repeat protein [Opitutus sp. WL0086]